MRKPEDDGKLGRRFQGELRASIRALYGWEYSQIPDEKRAVPGDRYFGEPRACDLLLATHDGRTIYIEAKATSKRRFELRRLRPGQRAALEYLAEHGHAAVVAINFQLQDIEGGRFVNEAFAVPAGLLMEQPGPSASPEWFTEHGRRMERLALPGGSWGWDVRLLEQIR